MAAGSIPAYGYLLQAFTLMKFKPLPPLEEVRKHLDYDPATGNFLWKHSRGRSPAGSNAGSINDRGYLLIRIDGMKYHAHRLAWLLLTGKDPGQSEVDHINRLRDDNSGTNLRIVDHQCNQNNTTGKGFYKFRGQYRARVRHDGKEYALGYFDCPLLARLAYEEKKSELCGEYSPV